jgi:hypothetical protein
MIGQYRSHEKLHQNEKMATNNLNLLIQEQMKNHYYRDHLYKDAERKPLAHCPKTIRQMACRSNEDPAKNSAFSRNGSALAHILHKPKKSFREIAND